MSDVTFSRARQSDLGRRSALGAIVALGLGASATMLAAQGCGDERINPRPVDAAAAVPPDASTPPPDAPPPIRAVLQRNPFGNVAITDNLLWDGDFEWSSPFADQYGWYQGQGQTPTASTISDVVVGPACKSGVKCARLKKQQSLLGLAVSAKDRDLEAWIHVKFEDDGSTPCSKAKGTLIGDGLYDDPSVKLVGPETREADGWCRLGATSPKRLGKVYFQIVNVSTASMLVDDAVIRPTGAASTMQSQVSTDGGQLLDADDLARVEEGRAMIRAARGPHDAPPNEAERSFEAWKKRKQGGLEP